MHQSETARCADARPEYGPWWTVIATCPATALFIAEPAAAYTVDKHADGSIAVSFRADRLKETDKLNA